MLAAVCGAVSVLTLNAFWTLVLSVAAGGAELLVPWLYVASLFGFGMYLGYRLPGRGWLVCIGVLAAAFCWQLWELGGEWQPPAVYAMLGKDALLIAGCVYFGSFMYTVLFPPPT